MDSIQWRQDNEILLISSSFINKGNNGNTTRR